MLSGSKVVGVPVVKGQDYLFYIDLLLFVGYAMFRPVLILVFNCSTDIEGIHTSSLTVSTEFLFCMFLPCYTLEDWYVHDLKSKRCTSSKCRSTAKVQICINLE